MFHHEFLTNFKNLESGKKRSFLPMLKRNEDIITSQEKPIKDLVDQIPNLGGKLIGSDTNWRGLTILEILVLEGFVLSSGGQKDLQVSAII